ncbi:MAG: protein kinase [Fimbriimonadaceae bacterium]|nr:protein kinase [Fimbriimonadaceae bacterium]
MSQSPPDTLGKYQIIREIARSNDIVYEGYDPVMNRRVAVKELAVPSGSTDQQKQDRIKRFMREAKAAGSLVHPNIVTVYDVAEQDGRFYLAMEYLDGQTLRKTLDSAGTLGADEAIEVAIEILKALAFAHGNGVVHRDVKPENIQILENGAIKLTDFGIARLTFEPNITMDGQVFGTPSYMSPEQINGRDIDARSDIFSLGIVLYEMLAGKKPFTGDSVVSITYAIMNAEPEYLSNVNHTVWSVLIKALDKSPQLRHSSADALINDLKQALKSLTSQVLDPIQPQMPMAQPQANPYQANSQYTPYGTPNPLYNPLLPTGNPPPVVAPAQQYNYQAQPLGGAPNQAIYTPYGQAPGQVQQAYPPQQYPSAYSQGAAYPPAQIPVYYPPPPRRQIISPEALTNLGRLLMAFVIIGALCGLLIFGIRLLSDAGTELTNRVPAQRVTKPTDTNPPASQPENRTTPNNSSPPPVNDSSSATTENTVPQGDPSQLIFEAESLVDEGTAASTARIRNEKWRQANEKFRDAIQLDKGQENQIKTKAYNRYVTASNQLASLGANAGAREALYQALGYANTNAEQANVEARLRQLGS